MDPVIVLVVAGVITFLAFAGWVIFRAWPAISKFSRFLDDVLGEPERPGVAARPGLMERMSAIEAQVRNSHVTNLRDDLDSKASKEDVAELSSQIADLHEKLMRGDL